MPIDYSKSKIYKLTTPHDETMVYYGSTVNPLYKRKSQHKDKFKNNELKGSSFKIFELGEDDVIITLVENVNCNSKEELHQRERHYIENNDCVNKQIPGRTKKEYYDTNKQQLLEQKKEYYEINKDIIRDKGKQYRENNKDTIKQRKKDYYEKNKEVINQKRREKKKLNQ
jgi:hypothetical protein